MTDNDLDPLAAAQAMYEATQHEARTARHELVSFKVKVAFDDAWRETPVYHGARGHGPKLLSVETTDVKLDAEGNPVASWGHLVDASPADIVRAFVDANEFMKPIEHASEQPQSKPLSARTLEGQKPPPGTNPFFHGRPMADLPDDLLLQMDAARPAPKAAPKPVQKSGKPLSEMSEYELLEAVSLGEGRK